MLLLVVVVVVPPPLLPLLFRFGFALSEVRTLGTKFPILVTEALWYEMFALSMHSDGGCQINLPLYICCMM
jgi:hypothetical protein